MTDGAERRAEPGAAEGAFDALFRREFGPITRTAYLVVGDWEDRAGDRAGHVRAGAAPLAEGAGDGESGRLGATGGDPRRGPLAAGTRARSLARGRARPTATRPEPSTLDIRAALLTLPAANAPRSRSTTSTTARSPRSRRCSDAARGTVKTHLSRGRQALAALLGEDATDELR